MDKVPDLLLVMRPYDDMAGACHYCKTYNKDLIYIDFCYPETPWDKTSTFMITGEIVCQKCFCKFLKEDKIEWPDDWQVIDAREKYKREIRIGGMIG